MLKPSQVVAHRGYQYLYPENTSIAIEKAIEAGAMFIEIDVQLSKDNIAMIYHDSSLKRTSNTKGYVHDFNAVQLSRINHSESSRLNNQFADINISRLDELAALFDRYDHWQLFVELKTESIELVGMETCLLAIKSALSHWMHRCILISFDADTVLKAREFDFIKTGLVLKQWANYAEQLNDCQADYGFINIKRLPSNLIKNPIACQQSIVVYEIDQLPIANKLLENGASMIETFNCKKMLTNDT